jgi:hypothetical protein
MGGQDTGGRPDGGDDRPVYLEIRNDAVRLVDARDLWGLDARQTQIQLKGRMGAQAQVLTIGPAGENLVRFATVQHSEDNAAGHSGFGAVWGSKQLKAIAVRGTRGVPVAHPDALLREVSGMGRFKMMPFSGVIYTSLDEYYTARDWDLKFGWPQASLLKRLGLEEVTAELDRWQRVGQW